MEETRISRMYLNLMARWLGGLPRRVQDGRWLRSGVTWIILGISALIAAAVAMHEKERGGLPVFKTGLGTTSAPLPSENAAQSFGHAPVVLSRGQAGGAFTPEFLSATLLPGRGLNVFQIMAFVPGRGAVPMLASPPLGDAAAAMSGTGDDPGGQVNLALGAAFEIPWAGRIGGFPLQGDPSTGPSWRGKPLSLPSDSARGAEGGLFLIQAASSSQASLLPDGGVFQANYEVNDFGGRWLSRTQVQTIVVLTGHNVDLTIVARNTGFEAEPMGIGWRPHFVLAPAERAQMLLRLPSSTRADTRTGHLLPAAGTPFDFSSPDGTPLPATPLNESYVQLRASAVAAGPETELRYAAAGYGLRMTALSGSIKAIHVTAPLDHPYLIVDPQTNYDDPLGQQWPHTSPGALTVLQPGESLEWKVRLEIFALAPPANSGTAPFPLTRIQP